MHLCLAYYFFWRGDIWGLGTLFFGLLGMGALQAGLAMLVMFAMNKVIPEKLPETHYGDFDFDNFQRPAFNTFVFRMLVIFLGTTLVLHLLEYLIVCNEIKRHWFLWFCVLFVFETAGIALGLHYIFKLDRLRLSIIVSASALAYILLFELLKWSRLLG